MQNNNAMKSSDRPMGGISETKEFQMIKEDLASLKDDATALAHDIKGSGKALVRDGMDNLYEGYESQFQKVEERVRKKPGQSILLAFAAGLAASYVLGARR